MGKKRRKRNKEEEETPLPIIDLGGPADPYDPEFDEPIVPIPYVSEQFHRVVCRAVAEKDFSTIEEVNRFIEEEFQGLDMDEIMERCMDDPVEVAQMLAFRALDSETQADAREWSSRALALDPDCLDAQTVQAQLQSESNDEIVEKLREIVAGAERKWGPEYMSENEGHFWNVIETRPYMRARQHLAEQLRDAGRPEEAIDECWALLRLNPDDNQGIRDTLLGLLLLVRDAAGIEKLIGQYEEDQRAAFVWGRALAAFQKTGAGAEAHKALTRAVKTNRYMFEILIGQREPPADLPEFYSSGDLGEAIHCLYCQGAAWMRTPGALDWLISAAGKRARRRRRR